MLTNRYSRRTVLSASASFAPLLAASLVSISPASAANFTAGTDQQLRDAIAAANASPDTASTITLTNSFAVLSTPNLATSNKSITINTQRFTLSGQGTPVISSSIAFSGAFPGGTLTLEGTYKGGNQTATVAAGVGLFVNGMTPGGNGGAIVNNGTIKGGDATVANSSGSIGVSLTGGVTLTNHGSIAGGTGTGGGAGNNMAGVSLSGTNNALINNAGSTILGGNSTQGFAGAGVFLSSVGNASILTNHGTIQGGSSGTVIGNGAVVVRVTGGTIVNHGTLIGGNQAAAIRTDAASSIAVVINSGTIQAGAGAANAIQLGGLAGWATLELQAGSTIVGNVVAGNGTRDILRLGGTVDSSFDTSAIGATAQYQSFETFEKIGTSTWTLTGSTGAVTPWTISQGTLSISADAQLGDPSAALTFNGGTLRMTAAMASARPINLATGGGIIETGAGTMLSLSGLVAGAGGLAKTGAGTLKFTGDASGFTGTTSLRDGILWIDGKLGGKVDVLGGRLQGNGTIGGLTVANNAIVAPGNSVGTLNVAGDVSLTTGSAYEIELAGNGASDRIAATGTATLGGGRLHVGAVDPQTSYQDGQTYTILTAGGGVTGSFDPGVLSRSAFLDAALLHSANAVDLKIAIKKTQPPSKPGEKPLFVTVADTRNRAQTAIALDTLQQNGPSLALYNRLLMLSADEARAAFDGLSGEIHASTVTGLIEDSRFVRDAINDRLRSAFETVGGVPLMGYGEDAKDITTASVASERYGAWGSVFGSWGHFGGDGNAARLSRSTGGFVTGVDGLITDDIRLGLLAGYSHSSFKVDDRRSSASSDNYHLGIYGGTQWGNLSFRSGLAYTWSKIDSNRQVSFPGFTDSLSGDHRAGTTQVFGELGYAIKAGSFAFEPFANLAYVNVHSNGFTETGGAAALTVKSGSNDITFTTLGIRAATDFDLGSTKATARGMLGWRHGYGDVTPAVSQAFSGSSAFTIAGAPIARDAAVIEAGLDFAIAPQATLGIAYHGQVGSKASDHGVRADLNVKF